MRGIKKAEFNARKTTEYSEKKRAEYFERGVSIIGPKRQRELLKASQSGALAPGAYRAFFELVGQYKGMTLPAGVDAAQRDLFDKALNYRA